MVVAENSDLGTILQAATSAVGNQYTHMKFSEMDAALDFWNLMVSFGFLSSSDYSDRHLLGL